jgi:hypothetical protein
MKQTVLSKVGACMKRIVLTLCHLFLMLKGTNGQIPVSARSLLVETTEAGSLQYAWYASSNLPYMRVAIWLHLNEVTIRKENSLEASQKLTTAKKLIMPVKQSLFLHELSAASDPASSIQIWYAVKKGDTFYRIARQYASCSMAKLAAINEKKDWTIREGEKLLLGWINPARQADTKPTTAPNVTAKVAGDAAADKPVLMPQAADLPLEGSNVATEMEMRLVEEEVIGSRTKNESRGKSRFILHNTAIPGSMVTIYNPMMQRQVKAKVLGPIPGGMYREEVKVILSPAAARELGIIDYRFKVSLTYELPAE